MNRDELLWLAMITVGGFLLRLSWALSVHTGLLQGLDMQAYFSSAKNLADGYGLTIVHGLRGGEFPGPGGGQAIFFPPGYALTLGGVFKVAGSSLMAGKLLNVAAGTLTIPLVYFIARRIYGAPIAGISSVLFAVYPANIFWTSILYAELLFTLPFAAAILLLVYCEQDSSHWMPLAFGAMLGYATIIRPQAIVLLFVATLYWLLRTRSARDAAKPVAVAILGIALWLVPLSIWNTHRAGHVVLVSENLGYNLRIGHSPSADGRFRVPADFLADVAAGHPTPQGEAIRRSISYAASHPSRELQLSAKKVYFLYITDSSVLNLAATAGATPIWGSATVADRLARIADIFAYSLILLVAVSVPLTFSWRDERVLMWLIVAGWTAVHVVFFGEPRYHLPILVVLIPMASCSLHAFWTLVGAARGRQLNDGD